MLGRKQPAWIQLFKVAWRSNPRVGPDLPHALPQAITTPKRVTTTWEREIGGAWPEVEIVIVEDYTDIARWMERCAVSTAPTVIAIISQSLTSPGRITCTTAVQPVDQGLVSVPDLDAEGEPITDAQGRTIAAGRDWLGIDHDALPDRMAFRLPPSTVTPRPTAVERAPIPAAPATQEPMGQKASVTFGNLADIGKALRAARKARCEALEQQAESFQAPMFEL